jgi:large subunit ribosomal protein L23|mmetsp:Transcript_29345/g.60030  ORF Transcript_29345/g.60030 Transcript_29345/m.60030 type:complete len:103 (+) Transcript_29345:179-487(+)
MKNKKNDFQMMLGTIKYPIITDKATRLLERNKYTFMVDQRANKFTIKKIIEYIFSVEVIKVNTLNTPRKKRTIGQFSGYKAKYKKAIITLKNGDTINLFPDI